MCRSKEAWDHFLFVPANIPPRRVKRAADHRAFFQTVSLPVVDAHAHRGYSASGTAATCASMASAAPLMCSASSMRLQVAMMPVAPPMPAPVNVSRREDALALSAQEEGLLNSILPGFDPDTFIFRVSVLQVIEYIASLCIGSVHGVPKLCSLYLLGASWGPAIAGGAVWRLFLPMMLHANALHIFFNIFFQMRIGFGMEKQFGRKKFCLLYLFCGFLGNLISVMSDPMKLAVGASTSGFGLLGVWLAEVLLTWELLDPESRPRILFWLAFMVGSCVMMSTLSPNVDFTGHLGGSLAGFLLAIILADMRDEHRPGFYENAKSVAKLSAASLILGGLFKVITLGPPGPVPLCGTIFKPLLLPF